MYSFEKETMLSVHAQNKLARVARAAVETPARALKAPEKEMRKVRGPVSAPL